MSEIELKSCGCGQTPKNLIIQKGSTYRWRYVSGDCCGEWMMEARVATKAGMDRFECSHPYIYKQCVESWNEVPRPPETE